MRLPRGLSNAEDPGQEESNVRNAKELEGMSVVPIAARIFSIGQDVIVVRDEDGATSRR